MFWTFWRLCILLVVEETNVPLMIFFFFFFNFGSSLKSIRLFKRAEEVRLEGKIRPVKGGQRGLAALCSLAPRPKGSKPI